VASGEMPIQPAAAFGAVVPAPDRVRPNVANADGSCDIASARDGASISVGATRRACCGKLLTESVRPRVSAETWGVMLACAIRRQ